jgi:hypothetical protein
MQSILDKLKNGNMDIVSFFVQAEELWGELLDDIDDISIQELAERLHVKQGGFETICGERHLGKIVMGWSSIPHFYSSDSGFEEGNGERAYKLSQAFASSYCSVEVKHAAREASEVYSVKDYA